MVRYAYVENAEMILSKNIPFTAETFVRRCTEDVLAGRYAPNDDAYLSFLIAETEKRPQYRNLMTYIRVLDRTGRSADDRDCAGGEIGTEGGSREFS